MFCMWRFYLPWFVHMSSLIIACSLLHGMTVCHVIISHLLRRLKVIVEVIFGMAHTEREIIHVLEEIT